MKNNCLILLFVAAAIRLPAQIEVVSGGNVGIGTSSPGTALDIFAPSNNNNGLLKLKSSNNNNAGLTFWTGGGSTMRNWQISNNYSSAGGLSFLRSTSNTGDPTTSVMEFDASGNVGIGTTSPAAQLHVYKNPGAALIVGQQDSGTGAGSSYNKIALTNTSGHSFMNIGQGSNNLEIIWFYDSTPANAGAKIATYSNANPLNIGGSRLILETGGTERLRIDSSGNVGIGTSSPSQKLQVAGSVRATSFISDTTTYADFVFEPNYDLTPLAEVEAAIRRDGHLPGIPSEAEAKANGIDLSAMQVKLLQKIEELTLHQIAQEKRLNEQSARLQRLETENASLRAAHSP